MSERVFEDFDENGDEPNVGEVATWKRGLKGSRWAFVALVAFLPIFAMIYYLGYWIRLDGRWTPELYAHFLQTVGWVVLAKTLAFWGFGVFHGWNRHVTFRDLMQIIEASTVASVLVLLLDYFLLRSVATPRSVFLMDWGATIMIVGSLRCAQRFIRERTRVFNFSGKMVPTFIVGANDSGETLLRTIRQNKRLPYLVVGFLDDTNRRIGRLVGGVPVVGGVNELARLAEEHEVCMVLVVAGAVPGRVVRQLVEQGRVLGVRVQVIPSYETMLSGHVEFQPRPVSIEDLLRRDPVTLEMERIQDWIGDSVILVTGSSGSIGSEIARQLLAFSPRRLLLVDRSENGQFFLDRELAALGYGKRYEIVIGDITDEARMRSILTSERPDIIFHAAAYKHVPLMQKHPGEAVKNIVLASKRLADLADKAGVRSFVMISSDKAVNPTNVMGSCKRIAELYVQSLAEHSPCQFVTVRFGNVLDSAGSVVPIFRDQIRKGGPVTITDSRMQRFFMTIPEASQLVIQAGTMGRGGEIFVLDMGDPVLIVDLAKDMIRLSGLEVGKDIEVQVTGMRPGEKLYEELHCEGERTTKTRHPKIFVADKIGFDHRQVVAAIDRLARLVEGSPERIIDELNRILAEFRIEALPDTDPTINRRAA